jgi:hypothetical protein
MQRETPEIVGQNYSLTKIYDLGIKTHICHPSSHGRSEADATGETKEKYNLMRTRAQQIENRNIHSNARKQKVQEDSPKSRRITLL